MHKRKGFTLIELLVVIAIIALLMAILMPALRRAKEQAKRVYCASNLRQMGTALVMYCDGYDGRLPGLQEGDPWNTYVAYWKGPAPDEKIPVQFGQGVLLSKRRGPGTLEGPQI
ncbi:MAG: type II secretion system protein [Planctomycetota bacterium]